MQILSQLTTRIRLYGANCNDTALVMQAIKDTKVQMTIWPAICQSGTPSHIIRHRHRVLLTVQMSIVMKTPTLPRFKLLKMPSRPTAQIWSRE